MTGPGTRGGTVFRDASLVILGYALVRAIIYYFQPNTSLDTWSRRDAWMTIPRLSAFLALLALNRWRWRRVPFDFRLRMDGGWAFVGGVIFVGISILSGAGAIGENWPAKNAIMGLLATPMVGFFEEYAFRGAILSGLIERFGKGWAILLSSAFFTVFHIQAQPFWCWPTLFVISVAFANLRVLGFSLGWLASIHIMIDSIVFVLPSGGLAPSSVGSRMELSAFALYAAVTFGLVWRYSGRGEAGNSSRKPPFESL